MKLYYLYILVLVFNKDIYAKEFCGTSNFEEITSLIQTSNNITKSIGEPEFKLKKNKISVCWGETKHIELTEFSDFKKPITGNFDMTPEKIAAKEKIQKIINDNYKIGSVGIEFVGWKDCGENPDSNDLIIFIDNATATRSIATDIGKKSESRKKSGIIITLFTDKSANRIEPIQYMQYVALHEFGHVAGLRHEDIHPNSPYRQRDDKDLSTTQIFSDYDPFSVMSYHFQDILSNLTGTQFKISTNGSVESLSPWRISNNPDDIRYLNISPKIDSRFLDDKRVSKKINFKGEKLYQFDLALSEGDINSLKCLYKYSEKDKKRFCSWNAK